MSDEPDLAEAPTGLAAITDLINPPAEEPQSDQPEVTEDELTDPDAEELPTEPDNPESPEIDYDQVVPVKLGDEAEELTVGQLKDHYQENRQFHKEREDWENERMQQESDSIVARQEITELVQMLGDVNPEIITRLQQQRAANGTRQAELLLKVRPEWADPDVKARDRVGLLETWKWLGFSDTEFGTLLTDHRMVKGLSDLARYRKREKAALEVKPAIPKGQKTVQRKPTKAQTERAAINRAKSGTESEKMAAIGALIENG